MNESSTSLAKMLAILELFTVDHYAWTVEEIAQELGYTPSSAYRYVRELLRSGLLGRIPGAAYVVGAKVIELEALIDQADPVTMAARPVLRELAAETGCACLLSNVYGDRLINVLHVPGLEEYALTYVRGQPLPWFRGAPGKSVLSAMPNARVRKLFDKHGPEDRSDTEWAAIRAAIKRIREDGYCMSRGELDPDAVGFGAPVVPEDEVIGSVSLVCSSKRAAFLNADVIGTLVMTKAQDIATKIRSFSAG
ncbi:IclR family transcriptional regulator (plasmid) [Cupriavidus necator]|nr:IclR family transcriptional regulator [Cupriavidus necator]QQX89545.1 IclR family transcriptional regulator [Cupriavidus necator]